MIIYLTGIFILTILLASIEKHLGKFKNLYLNGVFILLILILITRTGENTLDYDVYVKFLQGSQGYINVLLEPSFKLFKYIINKYLNGNEFYLFLFYAIIGVSLKFVVIKQVSHFLFLSLVIYISGFYIIHEMTQIRAGVASAFILLSLKPIIDKKLLSFLLIITLATLFHYSALIALPLYLLNSTKIKIVLYSLIIPSAYFLFFFNINLISIIELIPIDVVVEKYHQYRYLATLGDSSPGNVFNYLQLSRIVLAYIFLLKWELLQQSNRYSLILIKIYIIAIAIVVVFYFIPAVGARASEILMPVEILLIPSLMYIIKQKKIAIFVIIAIGALFMYLNIIYSSLVF